MGKTLISGAPSLSEVLIRSATTRPSIIALPRGWQAASGQPALCALPSLGMIEGAYRTNNSWYQT